VTPTFAVSQFTTWNQSFEEDVASYRGCGVTAIEVCERKLSRDRGEALAQLAMVRDAGMKVTSVQPRVHALYSDFMCPELHDPAERMGRFRQTIDLIAEAFPGQSIPLVTISGAAPGHDFRAAHATARRLYRDLAAYAGDHGLRVMYEPLSPILMNIDTFTCTLDDALRLIEDVNHPAFGLMLDVWHVWNELTIAKRIAAAGPHIFGVHVCDWPKGEPRCPADRVLPGDGVIPLPQLLGAVDQGGYRGAYCLEIFSANELPDSLWRLPAVDVIDRGRRGFFNAWEKRS
jgi:sugar phosphate isomerase/epimerase